MSETDRLRDLELAKEREDEKIAEQAETSRLKIIEVSHQAHLLTLKLNVIGHLNVL